MYFQEHVNRIAEELEDVLDLDTLESKAYLNLLRIGPITASALAKEIGIDRAKTYRAVDKLVSRNIVSTTLSSPKLCIAVEPNEVLKLALSKKEEEVNKIKKSGGDIVIKINNEISINKKSFSPSFKIIQGRQNAYADISYLIENANDIIYIVTTTSDILKMYYSTIPEKINLCEKNGGKVRLIVEVTDPSHQSFVKRFNASETRISNLPSKGRMVALKDKSMIISNSTESTNRLNSDSSFFTNSTQMVQNVYHLCSILWESAKPLQNLNISNFSKSNPEKSHIGNPIFEV